MATRPDDLVVFLGPSLPAREAQAVRPCHVLPPARQGDVWRALALRPRAIALVDGVFEAQPSVWHHELLAALDAGVAVFGGGSMGALRAAELYAHGVVGVGTIFGWYSDGTVVDDSEVALLHADAEHDFRPLTLPLVNVRHAAEQARKARVLTPAEARALVVAAEGVFYQERTWRSVLDAAAWKATTRAKWDAWAAKGLPDLKRLDALATVQAAADFLRQPHVPRAAVSTRVPSAAVRRRRLRDGASRVRETLVASARIVDALSAAGDAQPLAERGLTRALLAAWAREAGLVPTDEEVHAAEEEWLAEAGVSARERDAFLAACGLDEAEARALCETRALERRVLANAERWVADGPSWMEGLVLEARWRGRWAAVARELGGPAPKKRR